MNLEYFANIDFLKCYKDVFRIEMLKKNFGFFNFILILLLFFVTLILFYIKYFSLLINFIHSLEQAKVSI